MGSCGSNHLSSFRPAAIVPQSPPSRSRRPRLAPPSDPTLAAVAVLPHTTGAGRAPPSPARRCRGKQGHHHCRRRGSRVGRCQPGEGDELGDGAPPEWALLPLPLLSPLPWVFFYLWRPTGDKDPPGDPMRRQGRGAGHVQASSDAMAAGDASTNELEGMGKGRCGFNSGELGGDGDGRRELGGTAGVGAGASERGSGKRCGRRPARRWRRQVAGVPTSMEAGQFYAGARNW